MRIRLFCLAGVALGLVILPPAFGAFVSQRPAVVVESAVPAAASADAPASASSQPEDVAAVAARRQKMEEQKRELGRLIGELQRSPRSFLYLRSAGFAETDRDFEKIITDNSAIFRTTRIVRRDEQGNRQIPGWPGVTLTPEFKGTGR